MRRWKTFCSTGMSIQDWWLHSTRYQPTGSRFSSPCTSHRMRRVSLSPVLLQLIQLVASMVSSRVHTRRQAGSGMRNLRIATQKSGMDQKIVFSTRKASDTAPSAVPCHVDVRFIISPCNNR